jgi:acyl-CoA dehydrogenase
MGTIFWLVVLLATPIALAYRRTPLASATGILAIVLILYTVFTGLGWWTLVLWLLFAVIGALNLIDLRRDVLTRPLLTAYRRMLPRISQTERDALEAGNVWWEGELFSGSPHWEQLLELPRPELTEEEQAFLDGPTETLCAMLDDWQITHELADLPEDVWTFMKRERFFALIIPKRYGGLEFSPLACSMILCKVATRSATAASILGVPNSLGPAELLLHYGTDEQRERWLPGLASGDEIPCFALTSPRVGSDATAITDTGVVCRGEYDGEEVIGLRLNWDKRYITLAPVATVLGLAFKLYDPEHLIGDKDYHGITAALIPVSTPGIEIGRRHFPINIPFQNGPTRGHDVFVPIDSIIGGPEMAGQGWRMLVQQLSVGRSIVLPSNALGGAIAAVHASGAYARIRRQFGLPIGKFHGVAEALARMTGNVYTMTAASRVTCAALNAGEKPSVPSAILKYHLTEMARDVANDAMDVQGGKAIMLGPKNYLARNYQSLPIAITVEGANILTRSLIIYGQGAIRCHPFVLPEIEAASNDDHTQGLKDFDRLLFQHIGYLLSNAARSFVQALTFSRFTDVPVTGATRRYYQHINRFSAAFALASDTAMLTLGGELKRKELISARLGDVLSYLYLASMVLKHYRDQGEPVDDLPLVEWSCRSLLYRAQEQLHSVLRNLPNRPAAFALRLLIFPRGRTFYAPADALGLALAEAIINPTPTRERLGACAYLAEGSDNQLARLQQALELAIEVRPLERRVFDARRRGEIETEDTPGQIDEAESKGILTADEANSVREFDALVMDLTGVDDFDPAELSRTHLAPAPRRPRKRTKKRATNRSPSDDKPSDSTDGD